MENLLDSEQTEFFFSILADPEKVNGTHTGKLEKLVKAYPQVGVLRALLARACNDNSSPEFSEKLKSASVYASDRGVLYKLINQPDKLHSVDKSQIFFGEAATDEEPELIETAVSPLAEPDIDVLIEEEEEHPLPNENIEIPLEQAHDEDSLPEAEEDEVFDEDQYLSVIEGQIPRLHHESNYLPDTAEKNIEEQTDTDFDEDEYRSALEEETSSDEEERPSYLEEDEEQVNVFHDAGDTPDTEKPESEIDDEVFDEITGIDDINIEPASFQLIVEDGVIPRDVEETADIAQSAQVDESKDQQPNVEQYSDEERLIIGNIAATDYFAVGSKLGDRMAASYENKDTEDDEPALSAQNTPALANQNHQSFDDGRVSKYHDDKMPYTFMWWLDKTRREHAGIYQPYAPYKQVNQKMMQTDTPSELQRQYYENIFHLTTIENLDKTDAAFNGGKQESDIIERFIKEEPQIKPPSNDKLDNENKAKKSAEDQDELVSETLARIYMDQMLYHKAISTYKKLLLKFPEKSSYFVAQIELLERKIN